MKNYLLVIIMFLLTGCVSASGEPVVVMTQSEYDKHIRGAVIAGRYSLCIQNFPLNYCREDYQDLGKPFPQENSMTPQARADHTKAVRTFIDSGYDEVNGLDFEAWEQWVLNSLE